MEPAEERETGTSHGNPSPCGDSPDRYTFFYETASPFSQHHRSVFTIDGVQYNCAEQYMMHQKAVLFNDGEAAAQILAAKNPRQQKALGRRVKNFVEDIWNENCRDIVKKANMAKFSQNDDLLEALLATKGTILVEASPDDNIWGIGLAAADPKALHKETWQGRNWLGYTLTEVRDQLIQQPIQS